MSPGAAGRLSPARLWQEGAGIVFLCFFLSGATGLIYQVIWLRLLSLVVGHTVYAITTVLAAFMAGLALGSFIFARFAGRIRNLVGCYGWIEIAIGVSCALIPLLLWLAAEVYLGLHRTLGFSYSAFSVVQFLLVFALLLVPTTLMGGTLPVLSQALARQAIAPGRTVGALYAVNTFGAVAGVILAGYFLLPAFGNRITIGIAVAANLAVGVLAIAWSRSGAVAALQTGAGPEVPAAPAPGAPEARRRKRRAPEAPPPLPVPGVSRLAAVAVIVALGISGAVSMVYEVAWTRALALVIGSSTYAFTAMLVAFLVGIAGGSALYGWLLGARRAGPATFAGLQAGIGIAVGFVLLIFDRIPLVFIESLRWSQAPTFVHLVQFLVSAGTLLLFTVLIGATFPCAIAVAARAAARIGKDVGDIYAVNTLGAIAGTMVGGFVLIPWVGLQTAVKIGAAVNLLLAAGLLVVDLVTRPRVRASLRQWAPAGVAAALALGVLLVPRWDEQVMSSGPAIYARGYLQAAQRRTLPDILRAQKVLYYRDGLSGTVAVTQEGQHIFLRVNGKMDAGTAVDMPTQLMLGHVPMLVHPEPRRILVIGLGSGITAGAVARYPVERVDLVEIEPAVVEASRFFAPVNGNVLDDPRVRTVVADGRNFLLTTPERYDVIVSEPSNPWIGGLASLFSQEFFALARSRLSPGGVMVQWLQGYNLRAEDFQMVVKTFRTAFPAVSVWNTIRGDFLLLGRLEVGPLDLGGMAARYQTNPGVWQDLERIAIRSWPGVLGYFMLGEADTARFAEPGGINTDDRLPLEFSAPRALYLDTTLDNWNLVRSYRTEELPPVTAESQAVLDRPDVRHQIGLGYARREVWQEALQQFQHALDRDPAHAPSLLAVAGVHLRLGRPAEALRLARGVTGREPANAEAFFIAGLAAEALRTPTEAVGFLERAVALAPRNQEYRAALSRASLASPR
jgi:spermidine synthase